MSGPINDFNTNLSSFFTALAFDLQKYSFLTKNYLKIAANHLSAMVSLPYPADHQKRYIKQGIEYEPENKVGYYQYLSHRQKC